jgi:hypothetical protein
MGSVVWAGFIAFFIVSLVVGVRLVALWQRTRQLPELLIGIGVLGIGPIGFGAMMLGATMLARGASPEGLTVQGIFALGTATVIVGVIAKCVFNWRVYRPDSLAAKVAIGAIGLALATLYVRAGLYHAFIPTTAVDGPALLQSLLQVSALLWGSAEALHYWSRMRRRAALGLADPVVANRFLLWSFGAGAAGVGTAIGAAVSWHTGLASLQIPWVVASSSAHGLAAAIAMWLAFMPPRAYTAWIRQRGELRTRAT